MTVSAVGATATAGGNTASRTYSVTMGSLAAGDIICVVAVSEVSGGGPLVASITGAGAVWARIILTSGANGNIHVELWYGIITNTALTTVTVTWRGAGTVSLAMGAQQFHSTAGSAWTVGASALNNDTLSGTEISGTYPSLTGGNLYVGGLVTSSTPAGSSAGFTYKNSFVTIAGGGVGALVYGLNVSGLNDPAWSQPAKDVYATISVLISPGGSTSQVVMIL